ncbi:MAG: hypothetical protein A2504_16730 [Bdellovibrionales bacterium RIFOXYD12_FULL_39_22]|nr:MAG: hypothetical protein A2385_14585 [Bdellovibrionales bacterium RIFOXYB1_FULL_39_21]OFZ45016.1 MAG: hypothetical protein A2485_14010 [Bdellovibrionales bacterium RIFOXYC12_FULL_39_17]OFZ49454.1 MAG: hypothetical protein A2404_08495 [Bdellovibrionales bacterium RIFOXYC1_FULL_39_130]OFZ68478.1 MAG: hypothetical protein A2451_06805 [Bdellovibrionales bacterium RIFOXYC2_FULL_39_8]OFZ77193.1 MAG: hypothetical protein A2560_08020 [Bdellovibrionales bacterium RIFOXYD1_FULL_39_84]OFZ95638.1 MAG:
MAEIEEKHKKYFKSKKMMLFEPSTSVRTTIRRLMVEFGIESGKQVVAADFHSALEIIKKDRPDYIFSCFEANRKNFVELLEAHLEVIPNRLHGGFYVLSEKNSMAIAAMVLDYDIDAFFSQPITYEAVRNSVLLSLTHKVDMDAYMKSVEDGKEKFRLAQYNTAQQMFDYATTLSKDVSLANAWLGNTYVRLNKLEEARAAYRKGLESNNKSYNCIKGLIDLSMQMKRYEDAYTFSKKLIENYPVNPNKIADLVRLSITNHKYEDVVNYCKIFSGLEEKTDAVKKHLAAGLAVCGKYLIAKQDKENGVNALMEAAKLSDGKREILYSVIKSLLQVGAKNKAQQVLEEYSNDQTDAADFSIMELEIVYETEDPGRAFNLGSSLLKKGIKDHRVFEIVIKTSLSLGRDMGAIENITFDAIKAHPDKKELFNGLLSK